MSAVIAFITSKQTVTYRATDGFTSTSSDTSVFTSLHCAPNSTLNHNTGSFTIYYTCKTPSKDTKLKLVRHVNSSAVQHNDFESKFMHKYSTKVFTKYQTCQQTFLKTYTENKLIRSRNCNLRWKKMKQHESTTRCAVCTYCMHVWYIVSHQWQKECTWQVCS